MAREGERRLDLVDRGVVQAEGPDEPLVNLKKHRERVSVTTTSLNTLFLFRVCLGLFLFRVCVGLFLFRVCLGLDFLGFVFV